MGKDTDKHDRQSASRRKGELPGEYRQRSLVPVAAGNWADRGEITMEGLRVPEDFFVLTTSRLDGRWSVVLATQPAEGEAQRVAIPHEVVERLRAHVNRIMADTRQDSSRDSMIRRMAGPDGERPFGTGEDPVAGPTVEEIEDATTPALIVGSYAVHEYDGRHWTILQEGEGRDESAKGHESLQAAVEWIEAA